MKKENKKEMKKYGKFFRSGASEKIFTKDTKKMLSIIKRNYLNFKTVAEMLELSQPAISTWFSIKTNPKGTIRKKHFQTLKSLGIS